MINIKNKYKIIISCILICLFGLLMVYSSSTIWAEYKFNDSLYYFKHQGLFFLVGLIAMYIVSKIDYKLYLKYKIEKGAEKSPRLAIFSFFFIF